MALALTKELRSGLRTAMLGVFDPAGLEVFLADHLNIVTYAAIVRSGVNFEIHCFDVILWAEKGGHLKALCLAFRDSPMSSGNAELQNVVSAILTLEAAAHQSQEGPVWFIGPRPFLNRESLRTRLKAFPTASGLERVLLVGGDAATGKSYSEFLVSRYAGGARYVGVRLGPSVRDLEASDIATAIWKNFAPRDNLSRFDDLGQQTRDAKWYGDELVARLSDLSDPTWLFVDDFDTVGLSPTAAEPLIRLCKAIETGQCKNLWLLLAGLTAKQLGADYESIVDPDQARGPTAGEIAVFLRAVANSAGKTPEDDALMVIAFELYQCLGNPLSYAGWEKFHRLLKEKCRVIRGA